MVLELTEFKQVQKGTRQRKEQTRKVNVSLWDDGEQTDYIFVGLPNFWIRIDLADKTFSVGDYEG